MAIRGIARSTDGSDCLKRSAPISASVRGNMQRYSPLNYYISIVIKTIFHYLWFLQQLGKTPAARKMFTLKGKKNAGRSVLQTVQKLNLRVLSRIFHYKMTGRVFRKHVLKYVEMLQVCLRLMWMRFREVRLPFNNEISIGFSFDQFLTNSEIFSQSRPV